MILKNYTVTSDAQGDQSLNCERQGCEKWEALLPVDPDLSTLLKVATKHEQDHRPPRRPRLLLHR